MKTIRASWKLLSLAFLVCGAVLLAPQEQIALYADEPFKVIEREFDLYPDCTNITAIPYALGGGTEFEISIDISAARNETQVILWRYNCGSWHEDMKKFTASDHDYWVHVATGWGDPWALSVTNLYPLYGLHYYVKITIWDVGR